jgi:CRISPR/Cas system-associated exonuclease Cas4 (RecB family)
MFSVAISLGGDQSLQHYRPLAVSPELRGYADSSSSQLLVNGAGKNVSATALAARFCPTWRDLFLDRRIKVDAPSWDRSVVGHVVDQTLARLHQRGLEIIEDAFESAVSRNVSPDISGLETAIADAGEDIAGQILAEWRLGGANQKTKDMAIDEFAVQIGGQQSDLVDKTQSALVDLTRYEARHLGTYLRRRSKVAGLFVRRDWMAEVRATIGNLRPEVALDKGDGARIFGISGNVVPDFIYSVLTLGDIKTGEFHKFYESVATSYAIFAEHIWKRRINTAAILSVRLDLSKGVLASHHVRIVKADSEQRQLWVTKRDMALEVVRSDEPPRHPEDIGPCATCSYRIHCWKDGIAGGTAMTPPLPSGKQS